MEGQRVVEIWGLQQAGAVRHWLALHSSLHRHSLRRHYCLHGAGSARSASKYSTPLSLLIVPVLGQQDRHC
jgi:hypothetical protein